MRLSFAIVPTLSLAISHAAFGQSVLYVDATAASGGDGQSWASAYNDLQTALAAALGSGGTVQEIRVADGTYRPTGAGGDRAATFQLINGCSIKGGYAGQGAANPDARDPVGTPSILSGDLNGDDGPNFANNADNSWHVASSPTNDSTAQLDGFTIRGGNANGPAFPTFETRGGGLKISNGSPRITACTFTANRGDQGGGVSATGAGTPIFDACKFIGNRCDTAGGAIYNGATSSTVTNCDFQSNTSSSTGGGISIAGNCIVVISGCTFTGNASTSVGGGIQHADGRLTISNSNFQSNTASGGGAVHAYGGLPVTVTNCLFFNNTAVAYGGALGSGSNTLTLSQSRFFGNRATQASGQGGGAVYSADNSNATITSCVFSGNTCAGRGGAFSTDFTSANATFVSCTFAGNSAQNLGGGIYKGNNGSLSITNSIFQGNSDSSNNPATSQIVRQAGTLSFHFNCMPAASAAFAGIGNLVADPQLVDADGPDNVLGTPDDDTHLQSTSPCINLGLNLAPSLPSVDVDGDVRVQQCLVDIGADETPYFADCNSNGISDACDAEAGAADCDLNGVLDSCQIAAGAADCNVNGVPDICEISNGPLTPPPGGIRNPANGHYYLVTSATDTWPAQEAYAISIGGHLATVRNAAENDWIIANIPTLFPGSAIYLGLNDITFEGYWRWPSGLQVSYTNWATGQPSDSSGGEDWVEIYLQNSGPYLAGTWNDTNLPRVGLVEVVLNNDCNSNGALDSCDISSGASQDCNLDGIPDECQPNQDCNANGIRDLCEIGGTADCDGDGVTNWCQVAAGAADCNGNLIPDGCDTAAGNYALHFDGVDDIVAIPRSPTLEPATEFTIEAWVRADSAGEYNARIVRNAVQYGFILAGQQTGDGFLQLRVGSPGNEVVAKDTVPTSTYFGQWTHVAGVYSATQNYCRLYVNGVQRDDQPAIGGLTYTNAIFTIGNSFYDSSEDFAGSIDEVRYWSVARTQQQINDFKGKRLAGPQAGLIGYWRFDEGSGQTVSDASGNGNDGTVGTNDFQDGESADPAWIVQNNATPSPADCNGNGIPDACDVANGAPDCNANSIPDSCEPDCNANGAPDDCDIALSVSHDCNTNGIPDECELSNQYQADSTAIAPFDSQHPAEFTAVAVPDAHGDVTLTFTGRGAFDNPSQQYFLIDLNGRLQYATAFHAYWPLCAQRVERITVPQAEWNAIILEGAGSVTIRMRPTPFVTATCPESYIQVAVRYPTQADCNHNGVPDSCDIATGHSQDCNLDGIPDECSPDCNFNGVPDVCDIFNQTSNDCNHNRVPDACEVPPLAANGSDCDLNGIPDNCEQDCNGNGFPDACDIAAPLVLLPAIGRYQTGTPPQCIVRGDIDGDGDSDLLVTYGQSSGAMMVFRNRGDGTYLKPVYYNVGRWPTAAGFADLDADGDLDAIIACTIDNTIMVYRNNGNGTLGSRLDIFLVGGAGSPTSVAAGDIDGDGRLDLICGSQNGASVSVLRNKGFDASGVWQGFLPSTIAPAGSSARSAALADFDGDGRLDVVSANSGTNTVSILINRGPDGTGNWLGFAAPQNFVAASGPWAVVVADLNGDQRPDVCTAASGSNTVAALLNLGPNGSGQWLGLSSSQTFVVGTRPLALAAADFNGDGPIDLAVTDTNFPGSPGTTFSVLRNAGNDSTGAWLGFLPRLVSQTGPSPSSIVAGQFDQDSSPDIAVLAADGNEFWAYKNDGSGQFPTNSLFATGRGPNSAAIGEIDGVAPADFVVANRTDSNLSIYSNAGNGSFNILPPVSVGSAPERVILADLDGDGRLDAVTADFGANGVSVLRNLGRDASGWLGFAPPQAYPTGLHAWRVIAAELNGQPGLDLAVLNGDSSQLSILLNNGAGLFAAAVNYPTGPAPASLASADFDHDGDNDIMVGSTQSTNLLLFLNNGDGTFPPASPLNVGIARGMLAADLDSDGWADLAGIAGSSSTGLFVLRNRGADAGGNWLGFAPNSGTAVSGNPFAIVGADLNNDSKLDLVVTNEQDGTITIYVNIGNATFQVAGSPAVGSVPRGLAAGELGNDAFPDLVVTGAASNIAAVILNQSLGAGSPDCNVNLLPDECDTLGDLNGDGVADINDADLFVTGILGTPCSLADLNHDGSVNGLDIQAFVNQVMNR